MRARRVGRHSREKILAGRNMAPPSPREPKVPSATGASEEMVLPGFPDADSFVKVSARELRAAARRRTARAWVLRGGPRPTPRRRPASWIRSWQTIPGRVADPRAREGSRARVRFSPGSGGDGPAPLEAAARWKDLGTQPVHERETGFQLGPALTKTLSCNNSFPNLRRFRSP